MREQLKAYGDYAESCRRMQEAMNRADLAFTSFARALHQLRERARLQRAIAQLNERAARKNQ